MLKVPGISTSPRLKGNSDLLLRQALSGAEQAGSQVEYLRVCDYKIDGCRECYACATTGQCQVKDDYQPILDKMLQTDRIIFACAGILHDSIGAGKTADRQRTMPLGTT